MHIEDLGRGLATIGAWAAPAVAAWATGSAYVALTFFLSTVATMAIWKDS